MNTLYQNILDTLTADKSEFRDRSFEELLSGCNRTELLETVTALEQYRRQTTNLYQRVRATLFLFALYRFRLMGSGYIPKAGHIPYAGVQALRNGTLEQALDIFQAEVRQQGQNEALASALAETYHQLAFSSLRSQVQSSLRQSPGNDLLFTIGSDNDYPFRVAPEMKRSTATPLLFTRSAVRMDPSHSGWSDIFFLGMDYPEGARVVNISIDLAVKGSEALVAPPVQSFCRIIPEPIIRICALDLAEAKEIHDLDQVYNVASDHLGLLKAGIVASGVIPPSLQGSGTSLQAVLHKLLGGPHGFELVTCVRGIPKGSRLAVSTSLLACIITNLMSFSGQTTSLTGPLTEPEKRLVASRAILGEWLGGSGGGWQDSGGIWPGTKIITGKFATEHDPEYGMSRGTLLPEYRLLEPTELDPDFEQKLTSAVILVHGGMAQNVGPVLELVTEKYLLRNQHAWQARQRGYSLFDQIVQALKKGDMHQLGWATTENFETCIEPIIPWVNNSFTAEIRTRFKDQFGDDFWGFLMLGGMTGGGMAFLVNPDRRPEMERALAIILRQTKLKYERALPFAMDPVIYTFQINQQGIRTTVLLDKEARLPEIYYQLEQLNSDHVRYFCSSVPQHILHNSKKMTDSHIEQFTRFALETERLKEQYGFDTETHERLKRDVKNGKISIMSNRLPQNTIISDVSDQDVQIVSQMKEHYRSDMKKITGLGQQTIEKGGVAVVTLAAGLGSRWTEGAGVVKIINPFVKMNGKHRCFAEIHLAKTRKASAEKKPLQHVFTTSFLTHQTLEERCDQTDWFGYDGPIYLSKAQALGQKLVPTVRDLEHYLLKKNKRSASNQINPLNRDNLDKILDWARQNGEGQDYTANEPHLCLYPPGHWYEIPTMFRNGVLARMIRDNPNLEHLLVHNADTVGAWLDPLLLGLHLQSDTMLTFEVMDRRIEDAGGGLARVNGHLRLIEGLALPHAQDEYALRYYNTLTTWINLDRFFDFLGITRNTVLEAASEQSARTIIHRRFLELEQQLPTYATIKEVKLRWGAGQEDLFPILQCEKLWGDLTGLPGVSAHYLVVDRHRGQQLKNPNYLDRWANDGSQDYVLGLCKFA